MSDLLPLDVGIVLSMLCIMHKMTFDVITMSSVIFLAQHKMRDISSLLPEKKPQCKFERDRFYHMRKRSRVHI